MSQHCPRVPPLDANVPSLFAAASSHPPAGAAWQPANSFLRPMLPLFSQLTEPYSAPLSIRNSSSPYLTSPRPTVANNIAVHPLPSSPFCPAWWPVCHPPSVIKLGTSLHTTHSWLPS